MRWWWLICSYIFVLKQIVDEKNLVCIFASLDSSIFVRMLIPKCFETLFYRNNYLHPKKLNHAKSFVSSMKEDTIQSSSTLEMKNTKYTIVNPLQRTYMYLKMIMIVNTISLFSFLVRFTTPPC